MRQIILDTETTGLDPLQGHRIIEIGCIELVNRRFTGKRFHQYINPQREIEADAIAVHGITNEFLSDKPTFSQVYKAFVDFITNAELVIHNAPFDVSFIDYELAALKKGHQPLLKTHSVIDTLVMARQLHIGQRNSLDALCKRYSVDNSKRELHGALLDAQLLAEVYLAMTGGQSSFFGKMSATESMSAEMKTTVTPILEKKILYVQKASEDELALHEEYLKNILKKGKCVWLEN